VKLQKGNVFRLKEIIINKKQDVNMFERNYNVFVLKYYCMSYNIELHNTIINNLKKLIGKDSII